MLWLRRGFEHASRRNAPPADDGRLPVRVSVIIAARNERENIRACLDSIFGNDYPLFEVVVVDDASDDGTAEIVEKAIRDGGLNDRAALVRLPPPTDPAAVGHKKRALLEGIRRSRGQIIVTTDADCVVSPRWLATMISRFENGADVVAGPVAYTEGPGLLGKAVALELLGLVAVAGGGIANGYPIMCNGANLAYRRDAFDRVGGFDSIDHLSSGDDALLMLKIAGDHPDRVRFCAHPEALVTTRPTDTWSDFFAQRTRWASKGLKHGRAYITLLAVLVYSFHAALFAAALASVVSPVLLASTLAAAGLKISSEGMLLLSSCRQYGRSHLIKSFLPAQLVQIPYVVVVGITGIFGGGFRWKGRRLAQ
jgi:cellulose synthase/poly-beta-1,6-N-acetylglucosamine synthase-like glycosyltransferase